MTRLELLTHNHVDGRRPSRTRNQSDKAQRRAVKPTTTISTLPFSFCRARMHVPLHVHHCVVATSSRWSWRPCGFATSLSSAYSCACFQWCGELWVTTDITSSEKRARSLPDCKLSRTLVPRSVRPFGSSGSFSSILVSMPQVRSGQSVRRRATVRARKLALRNKKNTFVTLMQEQPQLTEVSAQVLTLFQYHSMRKNACVPTSQKSSVVP